VIILFITAIATGVPFYFHLNNCNRNSNWGTLLFLFK
jgi:hypothetical protein